MRWFEGVWWRKRRLVGEHGRRSAAVVPAGVVAVFRFSTGIIKGHGSLKLIPALRACVSNMLRLMQVLPL